MTHWPTSPAPATQRRPSRRTWRVDPLLLAWAAIALAIVAAEAWVVMHGAPLDPLAPYYVS